MSARRLVLFASTTGYQIRVFAEAARRLDVELTLATDRCHVLDDPWGDHAIPVRFGDVAGSLEALRGRQFDAVAAVGDGPAVLAAEAAAMFGIPFHKPTAVRACHDKYLSRRLFRATGMLVPEFFRVPLAAGPAAASLRATYPCVLKPLGLSASRGVIRADHPDQFTAAFSRIQALLEKSPDIRMEDAAASRYVQVETYIPGSEFAVEGIVSHGTARVLAIFDKPDPLAGPYFEETIYVTPSRASESEQKAMRETVGHAIRALGLNHGPFHAELRLNEQGAWILEVAARPIGGLCAKALRFGKAQWGAYPRPPYGIATPQLPAVRGARFCASSSDGMPLEELVLRHAIGEDVSGMELMEEASGVMMIPIPRGGVYEDASGVEEARAVEGIEDVIITAKAGQILMPLPEGATYLGFIFARGSHAAKVEEALRRAHGRLGFRIATALPTMQPVS